MYLYGEARLDGERQEGSLSLLSDSMVAVTVPFLPTVTPLMVPLSEEEVFIESEGLRNCHCGNDISNSETKWP